MASDPVRVTVTDPSLQRSRLTVAFRLVLAIPHLIVLWVMFQVVQIGAIVLWIIVLCTGRPPASFADLFRNTIRYAVHVGAYVSLAADRYPPFMGGSGGYAVDVAFGPYARQSRWGVAFRLVLALPALALTSVLGGVVAIAAFLGWFVAVLLGRMPQGLRDLVVYGLGYTAQAYAYLLLLTDRYPQTGPSAYPAAPLPVHPVALPDQDDLRRSRLTTFFRIQLSIPHLVWLTLWSAVATVAVLAAWLAALGLGRTPTPLHRFLAAYVRYATHVSAFAYMTANPFPGFTGRAGVYPTDVAIEAPGRQPRWTVLLRLLLAVPALLVGTALSYLLLVVAFLGWWAALVTGKMPRGLRDAGAFTLRYYAQSWSYLLLLTHRYPYAGPSSGSLRSRPAPPLDADAPAWMLRPEAP